MAKDGGKRRTYIRDASGRFASSPGGSLGAARKAAKSTSGRKGTLAVRSSLKRSRSKLAAKDKADPTLQNTLSTRAQKGAVTRGNKALKAAKTSSRQKLNISKAAGIISKSKKPPSKAVVKPSDAQPKKAPLNSRFRPGEFYRGNFRPRNVTGKPVKSENPFIEGNIKHNSKIVRKIIESTVPNQIDFRVRKLKPGASAQYASALARFYKSRSSNKQIPRPLIEYDTSELSNPSASAIKHRKSGWFSTSAALGTIFHEIGHAKYDRKTYSNISDNEKEKMSTPFYKKNGSRVARRVSQYAAVNPGEFIAETYAGIKTGRKYDHQVMSLYRDVSGFALTPLKNQTPIRRKRKSKIN